MNKKRGVTILECVIAMAVVLAVSSAAIVCIQSFSEASSYMLERNEAISAAENALEGFKYANTMAEFDSIVTYFSRRPVVKEVFEPAGYFDLPNEFGVVENVFRSGNAAYSISNARFKVWFRVHYNLNDAIIYIEVLDNHGMFIYTVVNYEKALVTNDA